MYTPIVQSLGPDCQPVHCPKCNQNTITKIKYVNGSYTWWSCIGMLFFGCFIPLSISVKYCAITLLDLLICYGFWVVLVGFPICFCSVFPFVLNICKDVKHYCGSCDSYIGKYYRGNRSPAIVLPPQQ
ncbi:unnamed protein product [Meloidogyne enterolobii]|uniref:Uncharacterized protein n=1 Tax=Meloidogyne enterolobii TaxID=390850 RepID=A0ACB1AEJ1_MELEN